MQEVYERLKNDPVTLTSVLDNISQPLYKDPLLILAHLQNSIPEPVIRDDKVVDNELLG